MSKRVRLLGIVLLLSLLICPSVLAKGPVELQFWTTFTGPDGPYMERMVNRFNAEHEGEIEVELFIIAGGADYVTKLALAIRTGAPPAVVILSPTDYMRFLDNLTSWTSDELLEYGLDTSDFSPNIMQAVTRNDRIYAVPLGTFCLGLYYNLDHLEAAGLEPKAPQTRDEFLEYARSRTASFLLLADWHTESARISRVDIIDITGYGKVDLAIARSIL